MVSQSKIPADPLGFIKQCIRQRKILWTHHINMRIGQRPITRDMIIRAVDSFEVIEDYPKDKYLPSYLVFARQGALIFHVQIAADIAKDNVRIVTAYVPDPSEWNKDLKTRRKKS